MTILRMRTSLCISDSPASRYQVLSVSLGEIEEKRPIFMYGTDQDLSRDTTSLLACVMV